MEHITVIVKANGIVKLVPDEGFVLKHLRTIATFSEAYCRAEDAALFTSKPEEE